jgi:hypothetical protein
MREGLHPTLIYFIPMGLLLANPIGVLYLVCVFVSVIITTPFQGFYSCVSLRTDCIHPCFIVSFQDGLLKIPTGCYRIAWGICPMISINNSNQSPERAIYYYYYYYYYSLYFLTMSPFQGFLYALFYWVGLHLALIYSVPLGLL